MQPILYNISFHQQKIKVLIGDCFCVRRSLKIYFNQLFLTVEGIKCGFQNVDATKLIKVLLFPNAQSVIYLLTIAWKVEKELTKSFEKLDLFLWIPDQKRVFNKLILMKNCKIWAK